MENGKWEMQNAKEWDLKGPILFKLLPRLRHYELRTSYSVFHGATSKGSCASNNAVNSSALKMWPCFCALSAIE